VAKDSKPCVVVTAVRGTGADRVDGVSGGRGYSVVRRPQIDLRFSIEDRTFALCEGERNTLDNEDFTCPVEGPVNGRTGSSFPMASIGVAVGRARLRIRDGQVAEANAEESQDHLAAMLDTDEEAKREGRKLAPPIREMKVLDVGCGTEMYLERSG
jgi:hypothetical protein